MLSTPLHRKHVQTGDLPSRREESGLPWEFSVVVVLFCLFLREAFKKTAVTLISENYLSGPSRTPLDSWTSFCGGYCPKVLTKTHVEEARAGLSTGLRAEMKAGREQGQVEGMAMSRASLDRGADGPDSQSRDCPERL